MKKSLQVIEQSRQQLAALGNIESRTQFGGYALSVEKVVFALINEGELYLRASEALRGYVAERALPLLVSRKRGIPVVLDYYKVDDTLWRSPDRLLTLSQASLQEARIHRDMKNISQRLKDLPNLSLRIEMMLRQVGICTAAHLREAGAKQSWLKLKALNKHLGLKTLLALQGAISGQHQAALPQEVKTELNEWYLKAIGQEALPDTLNP
jgi:DNA transformation protein and related proteins